MIIKIDIVYSVYCNGYQPDIPCIWTQLHLAQQSIAWWSSFLPTDFLLWLPLCSRRPLSLCPNLGDSIWWCCSLYPKCTILWKESFLNGHSFLYASLHIMCGYVFCSLALCDANPCLPNKQQQQQQNRYSRKKHSRLPQSYICNACTPSAGSFGAVWKSQVVLIARSAALPQGKPRSHIHTWNDWILWAVDVCV